MRWWADLKYRFASWLLGETWYIPNERRESAYLHLTGVAYSITLPVKDLHLEMGLDIPAIPPGRYSFALAKRTGTFSGTIADQREVDGV